MMRPILLVAALVVAACGSGAAAADADEGLACVAAHRGEDYAVGLEHPGKNGQLDFKLMSATPAPPGFSDNTWILQINAMSGGVVGAPATGATLTVTPFMPDHAHGTLRVDVQPMPDAGQYKLSPITLWMAGLWEITIDVQAGSTRDSTVYRFCIQA
ncbi:MAG TPA: FixH family protein [Kofleriaceae bacterium]